MPYVQRDRSGAVTGSFANAQKGFADEWLDDGHPDLAPRAPTEVEVERNRLRAYADPETGCDRFIAEAYAERLNGDEEAAKAAEAKLTVRRNEIKAAHPWPEATK